VNALRSLLRDGWVVGIACAAGLAYTSLTLINEALAVVFSIIDGVPAETYEETPLEEGFFDVPYSVVVNGHLVFLEPLLRRGILFVVTLLVAAAAVQATRPPEDAEP
jgi:hypothetical protein